MDDQEERELYLRPRLLEFDGHGHDGITEYPLEPVVVPGFGGVLVDNFYLAEPMQLSKKDRLFDLNKKMPARPETTIAKVPQMRPEAFTKSGKGACSEDRVTDSVASTSQAADAVAAVCGGSGSSSGDSSSGGSSSTCGTSGSAMSMPDRAKTYHQCCPCVKKLKEDKKDSDEITGHGQDTETKMDFEEGDGSRKRKKSESEIESESESDSDLEMDISDEQKKKLEGLRNFPKPLKISRIELEEKKKGKKSKHNFNIITE